MHSNCTNLRVIRRGHTTLNIVTGAMPEPQRFTWHLEPCNVPLFNRDHKEAGICRSCSEGWTHEHSYPATQAIYHCTSDDHVGVATILDLYPDLDADEAVLALAVGEETTVGGGAAPLVTVRRLAYPELHTIIAADGTTRGTSPGKGTFYDLQQLQRVVGGYIEVVGTRDGLGLLIVNEEGRLRQLPPNPVASVIAGRLIVGTAVLVPTDAME